MAYAPGTNTGHGHVWERPDGVKARCGGSAICRECAQDRIAELEAVLHSLVGDIEDYERINNLHPSPGKADCWQSVTHAKAVLTRK